ncbi:TetR/AcrR family transcriptional regulator [Streptomyces sp. LS1784]|uniref:TetR/AcrR family transcriptional regulator n=1 Tax=Streptomyces sp. LS1784 TaxID=2851533 RepID=UPI001CCF5395|nr:TetR/AcrR family transcriptional regulator [Streptomyces sp. LS1784]
MARPSRFDHDQFLDAAVRLTSVGGPQAVTMTACAQEVGAPSGSIYHRFRSRPVLLAEVWLRTVERFQGGYFDCFAAPTTIRRTCRAAARHVVAWSRENPQEAALLLYGAADFGRADWPEEYVRRANDGDQRVRTAVVAVADLIAPGSAPAVDRTRLALIDLPLAVVRRHLRSGEPLPDHAEALAEDGAEALLGPFDPDRRLLPLDFRTDGDAGVGA